MSKVGQIERAAKKWVSSNGENSLMAKYDQTDIK
jgi:hypothetical protein